MALFGHYGAHIPLYTPLGAILGPYTATLGPDRFCLYRDVFLGVPI